MTKAEAKEFEALKQEVNIKQIKIDELTEQVKELTEKIHPDLADKAKKIIEHYGSSAQLTKFIAGLGFLQTEISKKLLQDFGFRKEEGQFGGLVERLATVMLFAREIMVYYDFEDYALEIQNAIADKTIEMFEKE